MNPQGSMLTQNIHIENILSITIPCNKLSLLESAPKYLFVLPLLMAELYK